MLGGDDRATAETVKLPDDSVYQAAPQQRQTQYAQPSYAAQPVQAQPVQAQPVQAQYVGAQYTPAQAYQAPQQQHGYVAQPVQYGGQSSVVYGAQPVQQPVAPVYVAYGANGAAPPPQYDMNRYKYEAELERQRRMQAESRAGYVDQQMRYEERRRQQESEEACCCLAMSALCCAAFLAAN